MPSSTATCRWCYLVTLLSAMACGCAGPWAPDTGVPLPTSKAVPASLPGKTSTKTRTPSNESIDTLDNDIDVDIDISTDGPNAKSNLAKPTNAAVTVPASSEADIVVRGQSTTESADTDAVRFDSNVQPVQYQQAAPYTPPTRDPGFGATPTQTYNGITKPAAQTYGSSNSIAPASGSDYGLPDVYNGGNQYASPGGTAPFTSEGYGPAYSGYDGTGIAPSPYTDDADYADLVVNLNETQTGRFMFGVGVNSDLGLTAQAVIDERNFDWRRWPRSLDEVINGTAWRGGGQALRIEAVPGTEVQRYMVNFTQPYLFDTPISFNLSGYLYDRRYFDWDEQRLGARVGLGYRITPDLSLAVSLRAEQIDLHNVRVRGIPIVERALGESEIFSGKISLTHDTRDLPFAATQGHYLELSYEQAFGSFDFPRGNVDYRRYFLLRQRADGSGRHTLGFSFRGGITGSETPVYENFFAGGYSTMRGFRFRHASPRESTVIVGGQLSLLGSAEYVFPVTADDMLKGAVFCDYGTVEESYDSIEMDDFRVAIGAGLRISVPAMGPAPIAIDFAVPISREDTDRIQNISFSMGFGR